MKTFPFRRGTFRQLHLVGHLATRMSCQRRNFFGGRLDSRSMSTLIIFLRRLALASGRMQEPGYPPPSCQIIMRLMDYRFGDGRTGVAPSIGIEEIVDRLLQRQPDATPSSGLRPASAPEDQSVRRTAFSWPLRGSDGVFHLCGRSARQTESSGAFCFVP